MACKQGLVPIAETLADRAGPEKALWGFYSPMRLRYPPPQGSVSNGAFNCS